MQSIFDSGAPLDRLADLFRDFGDLIQEASPLYAGLSVQIAGDADLLALAAHARRGQPVQNMLFAAVHDLLLRGVAHPLAAYYPSVTASPVSGDPFPAFQAFCHEYADDIRALLASRRVQTNEVGRCALLLPAFYTVASQSGHLPLILIEVGASAGLNLLWDRYAYDYGTGRLYGSSPLVLTCELRGSVQPPLPDTPPAVSERVGLDLNPIDIRDADAVRWLRALVWPDQPYRMQRLETAIALAQSNPPRLAAGDALAHLPDLLAAPPDTAVCVYHSFVLNQISQENRDQYYNLLAAYSHQRDLYDIALEWIGTPTPEITLRTFRGGDVRETLLAVCEPHGRWLEWRA